MSAPTVTLDDAAAEAETTRQVAAAVRARLDAGDDVPANELAEVEAAEGHAARRLAAAQRREVERREREAAEARERDRAAMQAEWATYRAGEPAELVNAREQAVASAANYLDAYRRHVDYVDDLHERAAALGFAVATNPARPSPLPNLSIAILERAGNRLDRQWAGPSLTSPRHVWGR